MLKREDRRALTLAVIANAVFYGIVFLSGVVWSVLSDTSLASVLRLRNWIVGPLLIVGIAAGLIADKVHDFRRSEALVAVMMTVVGVVASIEIVNFVYEHFVS